MDGQKAGRSRIEILYNHRRTLMLICFVIVNEETSLLISHINRLFHYTPCIRNPAQVVIFNPWRQNLISQLLFWTTIGYTPGLSIFLETRRYDT